MSSSDLSKPTPLSGSLITDLGSARALLTGHHATLQAVAPGLGDAVRVLLSALDDREAQLASNPGVLTEDAQRANIREMLRRRTEEACRSPATALARLISEGFYTEGGELTPQYGGPTLAEGKA